MLLNFDIIIDEFFVKVEGYIYFVLYIIYFQLLYFKNVECEFCYIIYSLWRCGWEVIYYRLLRIVENIEFLCLVVLLRMFNV